MFYDIDSSAIVRLSLTGRHVIKERVNGLTTYNLPYHH
jgi:hypothetical protein